MTVKVTKKVKYATALYHKINATSSIFNMESFMLFSKSAHLLDYAALLYHVSDLLTSAFVHPLAIHPHP